MSDASAIAEILIAGAPPAIALLGSDEVALFDAIAQTIANSVATVACVDTVRGGFETDASLPEDTTALLVLDAIAGVSPDAASHAHYRLLGLSCRHFPQRVVALVRPGADLSLTDLLAFGFRKLAHLEQGTLHEYRLSDYKQPPDWLSARFWANPERFAIDEPDDDESDDEE